MKHDQKLISMFINSFGRRNFLEMESCLTDDFIFDATIIFTEGRTQFLKFQKKVCASYIINYSKIDPVEGGKAYVVDFEYDILLTTKKRIQLPAQATMYIRNELISKVKIEYTNSSEAKAIFAQMVYH